MLAGIGRDITERQAREQELTRTKELLGQAQRAHPSAVARKT